MTRQVHHPAEPFLCQIRHLLRRSGVAHVLPAHGGLIPRQELVGRGLVHGPAHSSVGQEGGAAGSILPLRVAAISRAVKDLASRARAGTLGPEEYRGGGFTISNRGMHGVGRLAAEGKKSVAAYLFGFHTKTDCPAFPRWVLSVNPYKMIGENR